MLVSNVKGVEECDGAVAPPRRRRHANPPPQVPAPARDRGDAHGGDGVQRRARAAPGAPPAGREPPPQAFVHRMLPKVRYDALRIAAAAAGCDLPEALDATDEDALRRVHTALCDARRPAPGRARPRRRARDGPRRRSTSSRARSSAPRAAGASPSTTASPTCSSTRTRSRRPRVTDGSARIRARVALRPRRARSPPAGGASIARARRGGGGRPGGASGDDDAHARSSLVEADRALNMHPEEHELSA